LDSSILAWIVFHVLIIIMLALDLGVFHRHAHKVSLREAAGWTVVWIVLALLFNLGVYYTRGPHAGLEFLTGYLIEKSLSVDNIFVFVLIFSYFGVPATYQHRVLFWGVLGAIVMRGILIALGTALIYRFHWIVYVFGAFLIATGIRMARHRDEVVDLQRSPVVRWIRRYVPLTDTYEGEHFFVRKDGRRLATPLFLVLMVVEASDLVFAVDSIPAVFAVTRDPFIVYTSNILAILGLRALYFLLAGVVGMFRYLKPALAFILTFVGLKMVLSDIIHVPPQLSLAVVAAALAVGVGASLLHPEPRRAGAEAPSREDAAPAAGDPASGRGH